MLVAGVLAKMSDEDPDYPAMQLANYMLGGSTGARLFKRIREKEGLSYSVQSMFSAPTKDDGGQFMAVAIAAPQNTPKAEASMKDELARTVEGRLHRGGSGRREERRGSRSAWSAVRRTAPSPACWSRGPVTTAR